MISRRTVVATLMVCATLPPAATAQPSGEVAWRIQIDSPNAHRYRQGIGPDGTAYVGSGNEIRAVSPSGDVLWTFAGGGGAGPIVVGDDGTIYGASNDGGTATILALHPDGTLKWSFTTPDTQGIIAGPGLGPDGNVYAAVDTVSDGIGVFSLDAVGSLRWSAQGDPAVHQNGGGGREIAFRSDRLYVAFKAGQGTAPAALWSFSLDGGNQVLYIGTGCESNPVVNIDGQVIVANGACGVTSYDAGGNVSWFAPAPAAPSNALLNPVIGPDGNIYTAHNLWRFWSLTPQGATRWYIDDDDVHGFMNRLGVSPDNALVLDLGAPAAGQPGWAKAYDTADGSPLWQIHLPVDPQGNVHAASPPAFTDDGLRAYFTAQVLGGSTYSFLYAIDLQGAPTMPADVNIDGVVNVLDLIELLLCFGQPADPPCPAADVNGDGFVNVLDLIEVLLAFGTSSP